VGQAQQQKLFFFFLFVCDTHLKRDPPKHSSLHISIGNLIKLRELYITTKQSNIPQELAKLSSLEILAFKATRFDLVVRGLGSIYARGFGFDPLLHCKLKKNKKF
jgi:hypothetical protein